MGYLMWGSKPLFLHKKLWVLNSLLITGYPTRGYGEIVSQPFLPTLKQIFFFLLAQCVRVTQLVFGCLLEEIIPYIALDLACPWEEVSLRSSYITVFNCPLLYICFFKNKDIIIVL